jgi:hypothetical protein
MFIAAFLFTFSIGHADLSVTPAEDFLCSGAVGGPFEPVQKEYVLTNTGQTAIFWGMSELPEWIDCSPEWGPLDPNETMSVTVSITTAADSLAVGEYSEYLIFTDITNSVEIFRQVVLTVTEDTLEPVAWWKLDGDATDSSGNGYDGAVNGNPNWIIEGICDEAIELDGDGDYISVPTDNNLKSGFPFSICLWMKSDNPTVDAFVVNVSPPDDDTYYAGASIRLKNDESGVIDMGYANGGSPSSASYHIKSGTTSLQAGKWYHVAAVFKGYMDLDLYINGISEGIYGGTAETIHYSDNDFFIGSRTESDRFFDGAIDDVRFYNSALTQAEILEVAGIGPLVVQPSDSFDITGEPGGPFTPGYKDYTLKNLGVEPCYWGIDALPGWLDVDASFGLLDPNESTTVRVFLTSEAELFDDGSICRGCDI